MPLISVIMGVYNCKDKILLKQSVESIINQSFKDWEFIICNDGSTDNTLQYLYDIQKLDSRIKIITYEKNQGLAYALNICINNAQGIYIARQDDDDISYSNRFEEQINIFKKFPQYSLIGTNADVYDNEGIWGELKMEEYPSKNSFLWTNPFAHPTTMIKLSALKNVGGYRVSKETRRCEDYDLFMRMYANGVKGYNIQFKLYKYKVINNEKKYRPMKYRIDEAIVRFKGYKLLRLYPKAIFFIFKPIIIGLIPQTIFKEIRNAVYNGVKNNT